MKRSILEFIRDESGQTSTEYILLVAVVALIVMKFKGVAVTRLQGLTNGVFDAGNDVLNEIKTP